MGLERHRNAAGHSPLEQEVAAREAGLLADVRDGEHRARLDDRARDRGGRVRRGTDEPLGSRAGGGADDEVVALEEAEDGGVRGEQLRRLAHDLACDHRRVEARGEQRPDAGQALRERARATLALEQLAALERAAGGAAQVLCEQDVLVGEGPRLAEDDRDGVGLVADARDRRAEERAVPGGGQRRAQGVAEALVLGQLRRGEDRLVRARAGERPQAPALRCAQVVAEPLWELVRSGQQHGLALQLEHERGVAAQGVGRGLGERVEGLGARERRSEHLGDPVEAALNLGLALALLEALRVVERQRGEAGEGLDHLDVALVEPPRLARADAEDAARPRRAR